MIEDLEGRSVMATSIEAMLAKYPDDRDAVEQHKKRLLEKVSAYKLHEQKHQRRRRSAFLKAVTVADHYWSGACFTAGHLPEVEVWRCPEYPPAARAQGSIGSGYYWTFERHDQKGRSEDLVQVRGEVAGS
jgi:hypothetical protein